jgi:hypothetical protein
MESAARLAAIRRAPSSPELGAGTGEARALCTRQSGVATETPEELGCKVGADVIFSCGVDMESRLTRCDTLYEGAELTGARDAVIARLGPPTSSGFVSGARYFRWEGDPWVLVTTYPGGVFFRIARR